VETTHANYNLISDRIAMRNFITILILALSGCSTTPGQSRPLPQVTPPYIMTQADHEAARKRAAVAAAEKKYMDDLCVEKTGDPVFCFNL
jgi:hypothetical protein